VDQPVIDTNMHNTFHDKFLKSMCYLTENIQVVADNT